MARPIVVSVGPLASASATQIALAQKVGAAGALVLNGVGGTFTANNVALSQSVSGAAAVVLNGALAQGTPAVAYLTGAVGPIYITSAGNDSGITFTIVGTDKTGLAVQTETLTGANASTVASSKNYYSIISITTSNSTAAAITVGTFVPVKLDKARRVIFTSGGNDNAVTITISGLDWAGDPISETLAGGSGSAVSTVLSYLTVNQVKVSAAVATTMSVGTVATGGAADSPWVYCDPTISAQIQGECVVSGTVNYTVQISDDDPNSPTNSVAPSAMTWDSNSVGINAATATAAFSLLQSPAWMRMLLTSGSGSVTMTVNRNSVAF